MPLLLFLLLSILQFQCIHVSSFASFFMDGISCYTNLRDTEEEVIMNALIQPPPPPPPPPAAIVETTDNTTSIDIDTDTHAHDFFIQVLDSQTQNAVNSTLFKDDKRKHEEYRNPSRRVIYIPESSTVYKYTLKLQQQQQQQQQQNQPVLDNVEYVMDVRIIQNRSIQNENENGTDDTDNHVTKNIKAKFTSSRSGCDHTRGYGHIQDEGLEFSVFLPYSVFHASRSNDDNHHVDDEGSYYGVEVVAGWARGHEAVTLTHPIYFLPQVIKDKQVNDNNNKEEEDDEYDGDEKEESVREEEHGVEL